jgi:GTP cyclohydrolase I
MEHRIASPLALVDLPGSASDDAAVAGERLERAYREIVGVLGVLGHDVDADEPDGATAGRAARAMLELVRPATEIENELRGLLARTFATTYDGIVVSRKNTCFGMCPHHLLPIVYRVSIAYLPDTRAIGLSKLSRIVHLLARRPVLQEDLTAELALVLHERLASRGGAALVEGLHMCMAARGIQAHEATVTTSALRGVFRDDPTTRQEVLALLRGSGGATNLL